MGIFRQFPYSNFHEMNMDEIIKIMREMQDEWAATKEEWASYKDFIDNYFANLDVSEEVLAALRAMAADGTLNQILDEPIANATAEWLAQHITPTTPPVDNSLSIAGAAADAAVTGAVRGNLNSLIELPANAKAVYDYNTNILTIPQGFITFRSYSYALYAQSVNIPSGHYGVLYYDHANRVILAADFNTHFDPDSVVGAFYGQRMYINGLGDIECINSITNVYDKGVAVIANRYGGFSVENGYINIPQGFYIFNGSSRALAAQQIEIPTTALNAYILQIDPVTDTVYATEYGTKASEDPTVGYGYVHHVFINGLGATNENSNIVAINNVMLTGQDTDTGYLYYDRSRKILKLDRGGFIVPPNGIKINVASQVVDFSDVQTTYNAYKIYIDKYGALNVKAWTDDNYPEMYQVGSIYQNSLCVYGTGVVPMNSRTNIKVFGDSIVAGTGCRAPFHLLLSRFFKIGFLNYGVGSTGYYANTSDQVIKGTGYPGIGSNSSESGNNSVNAVTADVNDFDAVLIHAGTNDYGTGVTANNFTSAVRSVLNRITAATSNVIVLGPIHRASESANSAGLTLSDYVTILQTECASAGVTFINGFDIPLDPRITAHRNRFFTDNIHPNDKGHEIIAGYIMQQCATLLGVLKS